MAAFLRSSRWLRRFGDRRAERRIESRRHRTLIPQEPVDGLLHERLRVQQVAQNFRELVHGYGLRIAGENAPPNVIARFITWMMNSSVSN
jgi:hypothetical protein